MAPISRTDLSEASRGRLRELLPPAAREELASLLRETDSEQFSEGLLSLGLRQEQEGRLESAATIYSAMSDAGSSAARQRLDALTGRGALGARAEFLLRNLAQQAAEPTSLLAMGIAGAAFRLTRLAILSRLSSTGAPGFLTRVLGAGRLASAAGFVVEASVFPMVARVGNEVLGRPQDWTSAVLGRDLASSYLVLGGLRFAGWASGAAYQNLAAESARLGPLHIFSQQCGMLGGILLGHGLETWLGLRRPQDGATTLIDSLATLLQFNVAGQLQRHAFGQSWQTWERNLDLQAETLATLPPGRSGPPTLFPTLAPEFSVQGSRGSEPQKGGNLVFMFGRGSSDWRRDLIRAASLRVELTPQEAWQRRAERLADYVGQVRKLPGGQREVMEELTQGLELLGAWAEGGDPFRRAMAYRHYAELWQIHAEKWSPVSLNFQLSDRLQANISQFILLLSQEGNPRFLETAVKAAPHIARIYTHTRGSLIEGSPRERDLNATMEALFLALQLGAKMPLKDSLREPFLEAFHDALNNAPHPNLNLARLIQGGLRMTREWLGTKQPQWVALGLRYFPKFWQLLAENAHPGYRDEILAGLREEIVFLQQNHAPHRTPKETLRAVLLAYPRYARLVMRTNQDLPGNVFMNMTTLLTEATMWRPWILEHPDPEVGRWCGTAYVGLMREIQGGTEQLGTYREQFPTDFQSFLHQELRQSIGDFGHRWKLEAKPGELPFFIEEYLQLVNLLPAESEMGRELVAESNLKPLTRLAYHPDPKVRQLGENALGLLLRKFSKRPPGGPVRN